MIRRVQFPQGGSSGKKRSIEADRQRLLEPPSTYLTNIYPAQPRCWHWARGLKSHRQSHKEIEPTLPRVQARSASTCKPPKHAPADHAHHCGPAQNVVSFQHRGQTSGLTSKTRNTSTMNTCEIYIVLSFSTRKQGLERSTSLPRNTGLANSGIQLESHLCRSDNTVLGLVCIPEH